MEGETDRKKPLDLMYNVFRACGLGRGGRTTTALRKARTKMNVEILGIIVQPSVER